MPDNDVSARRPKSAKGNAQDAVGDVADKAKDALHDALDR